ncbi:MAG: hypothetical protein OEZ24_06075 [Candidatus Bathyarchaeota archaeon]|nr:hypothetical protein [Candidatus Bathyarchaeota archaeon]
MSATPEQRLEESERELAAIKAERDRINEEALRWVGKRDLLHEEMRRMRSEAKSFRDERDELNAAVHQLKNLREEAGKECIAKIDQLKALRQKAKDALSHRPNRSAQSLESEIEAIEWKIQTQSLSLDEERGLVEQAKALESQMKVYREVADMNDKIEELQNEATTLKDERASYGDKISEMARESQRFHEKMIERLESSRKLKAEADQMHEKYIERREQARALHLEYVKALEQIKALREKMREGEREERAKQEAHLRDKLEKEALDKLKRGEKLTFEEFKILAEQGKI